MCAHMLTPPGAGGCDPAEGDAEREGQSLLLFQYLLNLKQVIRGENVMFCTC